MANKGHHEVPKFQKPPVKKERIPSLASTAIQQATIAHEPTPQHRRGERRIAQHSGGDDKVFVCALFPPLPTLDIVCSVLWCLYAYAKLRMR